MRCGKVLIGCALLAGSSTLLLARQPADARQLARLKQLFPAATAFSPKEGDPPHYTAYKAAAPGGQSVLGYAFWTTEVVPLERGYGGPIAMFIGVDTGGRMTGLIVGEHHEPYGDFSIEPPKFAAQFRGK